MMKNDNETETVHWSEMKVTNMRSHVHM